MVTACHLLSDSLLGAVSLMLMGLPESPKYLLESGRSGDAVKVLADMFHANTGRSKVK